MKNKKDKILGNLNHRIYECVIVVLYKDIKIRINSEGDKMWIKNNKIHNENGPAVIWADGKKWWYLNDKKYTKKQWRKELET